MLNKLNNALSTLREQLENLTLEHGLIAIKAGTEVEDMTFTEIAFLRRLTQGILPLYVKIGGPEARNDMRACLKIGVDGLIAPMVESAFALEKFISSLQAITDSGSYNKIRKGINLETITAFNNLNEIFSNKAALELDQVTAARSDLSASMNCNPEDELVLDYCQQITNHSHRLNLETSIGGKIIPGTVSHLLDRLTADMINTRHMVLSCPVISRSAPEAVTASLKFEVELYRQFSQIFPDRSSLHHDRELKLKSRLQVKPVLQN